MFLLLAEITFGLLLLISFWVCVKYCLLMFSKYGADRTFDCFCRNLNNRYQLAGSLINQCYSVLPDKRNLLEETNKLIAKAIGFNVKNDGNERIIGFANTIFNNMEQIIVCAEEIENTDSSLLSVLKHYGDTEKDFAGEKIKYNSAAKRLRYYVDVFPTSLIARLKNIRTMDYIN